MQVLPVVRGRGRVQTCLQLLVPYQWLDWRELLSAKPSSGGSIQVADPPESNEQETYTITYGQDVVMPSEAASRLSGVDQSQEDERGNGQLTYICRTPALLYGEGKHRTDHVGPSHATRAGGLVAWLGHESVLRLRGVC